MNEDIFHLGIKALIRNNEGKFLLLRVNPKTLKDFDEESYWDIPGGRIHRGSTAEETLRREVKEETGIDSIKKIIPFSMALSNIRIPDEPDDVGLILTAYICEVDFIDNIQLSDEHTEYGWFGVAETARLLRVKYPEEFTGKLKKL